MLEKIRIVSREYRNRRIGDFLKELQLTEGRATGFPKIYDAMKRNGSPEPKFETDDERSYFLAVLPVHPDMERRGHVGGQAKGQAQEIDFSDTEKAVLTILRKGPCSTEEIVKELGLTKRTGALQRTLKGLLEKDFIRYLYPETPRHPGQKYVLNIDH
ncbi:MAG: ATP-binding protein [Balneolaceae bacterium]